MHESDISHFLGYTTISPESGHARWVYNTEEDPVSMAMVTYFPLDLIGIKSVASVEARLYSAS